MVPTKSQGFRHKRLVVRRILEGEKFVRKEREVNSRLRKQHRRALRLEGMLVS